VPNKVNGSIHDMMKSLGCDPRMVLARIAMNAKNSAELRRKAASDLMNYMYPRLTSTEQHLTGEVATVLQVVSGIARLPTDPIDVTPLPASSAAIGASPAESSISAPASDAVALPAGRPWHPSPVDAPPASPSTSDRLLDENLDCSRVADAKIAALNSRAKFVA
jgi:hypothetical protein